MLVVDYKSLYRFVLAFLLAFQAASVSAEAGFDYEGRVTLTTSTGEFTPYYIGSMNNGRRVTASSAQAEVSLHRDLDLSKRFDWAVGASLIGGVASGNEWQRYDAETGWFTHNERPASFMIQELYGQLKWRGCFITAGLKEDIPAFVNRRLSSGDLVSSGNSRPIPQVRVGFIDFQNIPFTNGWVQIQGEIGYGKMTDGDWWTSRYNQYNYHVCSGQWYNYKRCYFRTNPNQPFSITVGMQAAAQFGGTYWRYVKGNLYKTEKHKLNLKSFWNALLPTPSSTEGFYEGNHLGTWDMLARYRMMNGDEVRAYFEWPWEDGSGIGRRNGWDGLWGLEWKSTSRWYLSGIVVEYLDMTNQCGPQHYAPGDYPGNTIGAESTGADDYYNNAFYNSYAHYGMSIGSPMLMAPAYNLDGYLAYVGNRMRGVHVALEGALGDNLDWRLMGSYRKAWGNGKIILPKPLRQTSLSADILWRVPAIKGMTVGAQAAYDHGTMPGNSFGVLAMVAYSGSF